MGSGSKSKGTIDMGNYTPNSKEQEAYTWCIRNHIYISPKAKSTTEWYLTLTINSKESISPSSYKKIDIWKQLYKFYVYYYDKYANKIDVKTVEDPKSKLKKEVEKPNNNLKLF
jgi:hypothetical protein